MNTDSTHIASIRKEYIIATLDEATAGEDPLFFFSKWFNEAAEAQISEVNAMSLATTDASYKPHVRVVLLKGIDNDAFVFFTNYNSAKGKEIAATHQAALLFFWKELERQVRIEGRIEKIDPNESDAYFHSRPRTSRLGAWASPQSNIIQDRNIIELNYAHYDKEFSGQNIPRPPHWGGYKVIPHTIEFWQGRSSRMHDRILFTKNDERWDKCRLAP